MLKPLIAAVSLLAIAGSSIGYGQQRLGGPTGSDGYGGSRYERHFRPNIDDIKAFTDARIAALKAGLTLAPDQEKNWPPFERALRDLSKLHLQRMQERRAEVSSSRRPILSTDCSAGPMPCRNLPPRSSMSPIRVHRYFRVSTTDSNANSNFLLTFCGRIGWAAAAFGKNTAGSEI